MYKENKEWNIFQKLAFEIRDFIYSLVNYKNWHQEELISQNKIMFLENKLKNEKEKYTRILTEKEELVKSKDKMILELKERILQLVRKV